MIGNYYKDVRAFHEKFSLPINDDRAQMATKDVAFRNNFLKEEWEEFKAGPDIFKVTDALVDMAYVAVGTMLYLGGKPDASLYLKITKQIKNNIHFNQWLGWIIDRNNELPLYSAICAANRSVAIRDVDEATSQLTLVVATCEAMAEMNNINFIRCWREVQRANMDKVPATPDNPSSRGHTSGDMVKPEGWQEPDFSGIIIFS